MIAMVLREEFVRARVLLGLRFAATLSLVLLVGSVLTSWAHQFGGVMHP